MSRTTPRPRCRVPLALSLVLVTAVVAGCSGCATDERSEPRAVTTTSGDTTVTTAVTTTVASTVTSTRPLTTVAPSPLLDEVLAAYDAAYADLLAATLSGQHDAPFLGDHIAEPQLGTWRSVIREIGAAGHSARVNDRLAAWRRVESIESGGGGSVRLEVCRFDNVETVDSGGAVVELPRRPFRYVETLLMTDGRWKWVARDWLDRDSTDSDCASP